MWRSVDSNSVQRSIDSNSVNPKKVEAVNTRDVLAGVVMGFALFGAPRSDEAGMGEPTKKVSGSGSNSQTA